MNRIAESSDEFHASLLNGTVEDEIDIFLESIPADKTQTMGDKQVFSLLAWAKDALHKVTKINELDDVVVGVMTKLQNLNSNYVPSLLDKLSKSLNVIQQFENQNTKVGALKACNAIRMIFASPEFRREDSGDSYQSTQVGSPGTEETGMPNVLVDDKTMLKHQEFPVSPDMKSNDPLVDMNGKIHEIDDLLHQAAGKAKTLQVSLADYSGSNTQTKIELVSAIGKLLRRLQQNQDMASAISSAISKRLKG